MIKQILLTKDYDKAELLQSINEFVKKYGVVEIEIKPQYQLRTDKQNSLWQIWVKQICQQSGFYDSYLEQGYSKNEIEKLMKLELKKLACQKGNYPYKRDERGNYIQDENGLVPEDSNKVCISDFKILLDTTFQFALEYGYDLTSKN